MRNAVVVYCIVFQNLQPIVNDSPVVIRVVRGPIASEVHVSFPVVKHCVRLTNSPGKLVDASSSHQFVCMLMLVFLLMYVCVPK